jgi:alpha-beta hydrolase superfamily lysophospholipase
MENVSGMVRGDFKVIFAEILRTLKACGYRVKARLLNAMLAAITVTEREAAQLRLPTLLIFAGDDHLVDPRGSEAFFNHLNDGVGRRHRYDALYHEIFNESANDAARVFADVGQWLDDQARHAT